VISAGHNSPSDMKRFNSKLQHAGGFTLIELMVALVILAVIALWAIPSFRDTFVQIRMRSVASDLQSAILRARSEAVQRDVPVTIRAVANDWTLGWTILTTPISGASQTLDNQPALEQNPADRKVTVDPTLGNRLVNPNSGLAEIRYTGAGFARAQTGGAFLAGCVTFASQINDPFRRRLSVVLAPSGRPKICNPDLQPGMTGFEPNCCVNTN
jgi:type IV fimbrial biogenesis protein FimT